MKLKFDFKSIDLENAATWVGAIILTFFVLGLFYGVTKYSAKKHVGDEIAELSEMDASGLYPKVPQNVTPQSALFPETTEVAVAPTEVVTPSAPRTENPYAAWGYLGDAGPANWAKLDDAFATCSSGKAQSPINLNNPSANKDLDALSITLGSLNGELHNDGRVLTFFPEKKEASLIAFNTNYRLKQIDFHVPSEHRINNQKFDMEMQFIFVSEFGGSLAIAVLAKEAHQGLDGLTKLWNAIPEKREIPGDVTGFNAGSLLPKEKAYYYYEGSLTVPPCTEKIAWVVMKDPVVVSSQQVDQFLKVAKFNARPLQKLAGRNVYRSW